MAHARKVDAATLVRRMLLSYPVLHASKVYTAFHSLLIVELPQRMLLEGGAIVLPCVVRVHVLDSDQFKEFCNKLSKLTANSLLAV